MLPCQNQQDVAEISKRDKEENVGTNLEDKRLPFSETKTRSNKMLTEAVIDRCQQILKSKYKMRYAFWIAYFAKTRKVEFVQILHNGWYHWVFVSNINFTNNKINYYDSLFHWRIKDHVKMQICNTYKCFEKELMFQPVSSNWIVLTVEFTKEVI